MTAQEQFIIRSFDNGLNTCEIRDKLGNLLFDEAEITRILHQALTKRRQEKSNG